MDKSEFIKNTISVLIDKYNNNSYVSQRLFNYVSNLPAMLDNDNKKHIERVARFNELTNEQENFHKIFLSKHQYFYMPFNNNYYEYDGKTYKIVKDDDIHYNLLSSITDEGKLTQWKHKTKFLVLKSIKERSLFKSTPETFTIQQVLSVLCSIFKNKYESKYFLTVLGDCVLKKNQENLMYFVSSHLKKIIHLIDSILYNINGTSIIPNFITKYHETHKLSNYRIINANDDANHMSITFFANIVNNIGIDLLCVATHYSERHGNADNYLLMKTEESVKNCALYFMNNPINSIIDNFIEQCIEKVSGNNQNISWKNMQYIWKLYLSSVNIPNVIYTSQLQNILTNKLDHITEKEQILFTGVTSKYLPNVSSFLSFWEQHITIRNDVNFEYEIDELMSIYKSYDKKHCQITDAHMIQMILHYFSPNVEVIDNKYVTNIMCNLWTKQDDIIEFLDSYKFHSVNIGLNPESKIISFDDLYVAYKNYIKAKSILEKQPILIVSKNFFENQISEKLSDHITFDKFVSSEWLCS